MRHVHPSAQQMPRRVNTVRPAQILSSALAYAARGFPVLPLHTPDGHGGCSCGRADCGSAGKHPRTLHGKDDATIDPAQIRRWWGMWSDANVGIVTGNGVSVLDVDPRNDGDASLEECEEAHGEIVTLTVRTGGGGHHYYFEGDLPNRLGFLPGLDLKGDGGYVVAPPSRHASGRVYEWVDPGVEPRLAPDWLVKLVGTPSTNGGPAPAVSGIIIEGERNATLTSFAGAMRRRGMDAAEIEVALGAVNGGDATRRSLTPRYNRLPSPSPGTSQPVRRRGPVGKPMPPPPHTPEVSG